MLRHLGALGLAIGLAEPVAAQTTPPPEAFDWMRVRVGAKVQQPPHLWGPEQVDAMLRPLFLALSRDGTRITPGDQEAAQKALLAQARASAMTQFLRADVTAEGRIDRETMSASIAREHTPPRSKDDPSIKAIVETYFRQADADADGVVTYREAANASDRAMAGTRFLDDRAMPMEFDLDGDGIIGLDEFGAILRFVFDEIDSDRDGRISKLEADRFSAGAMRHAQRAENERASRRAALDLARRNAAGCIAPTWASGSGIGVVVGDSESRAFANVTIGDGEVNIRAVNVHIEPGSQPLSVIVAAPRPTIWQFSGETARVASVFVGEGNEQTGSPRGVAIPFAKWQPRSGVVGIDRARVTFAPKPGCLPPGGRASPEALEAALGRKPETIVVRDGMTTAHLPSGTGLADGIFPNSIEFPKGGPGGPLWAMAADERETVVHVEPRSVVAAAPVARSSLPGLAGLATLVDEGRARIVAWQTVTRILDESGRQVGPTIIGLTESTLNSEMPGPTTKKVPSEVMILAPVTIPTGLNSSIIRRLILARGVPEPSGDRSICIIREEDGKPLAGWRCN